MRPEIFSSVAAWDYTREDPWEDPREDTGHHPRQWVALVGLWAANDGALAEQRFITVWKYQDRKSYKSTDTNSKD